MCVGGGGGVRLYVCVGGGGRGGGVRKKTKINLIHNSLILLVPL